VIKNIVNLNGEKSVSNSTNIAFFTERQPVDSKPDVGEPCLAATGANDQKIQKLTLEYQEPTPAVALKNATVELSLDAGVTYEVVVHKFSLKEDDWITPGQLYSAANGLGVVLKQSLKLKRA